MSIIMKFRCVLLFLNFKTPGAPNEESQIYGFLADCFKKKQQLLGNKTSCYSNLRTFDTFLKILAGVFPYRKQHFYLSENNRCCISHITKVLEGISLKKTWWPGFAEMSEFERFTSLYPMAQSPSFSDRWSRGTRLFRYTSQQYSGQQHHLKIMSSCVDSHVRLFSTWRLIWLTKVAISSVKDLFWRRSAENRWRLKT